MFLSEHNLRLSGINAQEYNYWVTYGSCIFSVFKKLSKKKKKETIKLFSEGYIIVHSISKV